MKYTNLFLTAIAGIIITACSSDNEIKETPVTPSQEQVEIKLGSSVNAVTRAAYTVTQGNKLASGIKVYAWIDDAGNGTTSATPYINAWSLTSGADATVSGLTNSVKLDSDNSYKFYFPNTGNNIDIYGIHGNFVETITPCTQAAPLTGATTFPATLTHKIKTNQTGVAATAPEDYADGYEASDLMVAHKKNCAKSAASHNLPFQHLLSKIEVYLFAGNGVSKSDLQAANTTITLKGTKLEGTLTLTKTPTGTDPIGSVAVTGTTTGDIKMKLQKQDDQEPAGYTAPTGIVSPDTHAYVFGEAIIIPQTIGNPAANPDPVKADFISVNFGSGGSLVAPVSQVFDSGKKYTYYITVNRTGIVLTATLSDWTDGTGGTPISGTAE